MITKEIKQAMVKKWTDRSLDQIVDDVVLLIDKSASQGFEAGYHLARKKLQDNIQEWKQKEINKILMS